MAIPNRWQLTLPLLRLLAGCEMYHSEIVDRLAEQFNLTDSERAEEHPKGNRKFRDTEVGFAKLELKKAGLIEFGGGKEVPARITELGQKVLASHPATIDKGYLKSLKQRE